ncbi:MAG: hypothetical protein JWO63_2760 [Frankiales bacterium]|nr:hypothetical protein [Frankiales bacterium]
MIDDQAGESPSPATAPRLDSAPSASLTRSRSPWSPAAWAAAIWAPVAWLRRRSARKPRRSWGFRWARRFVIALFALFLAWLVAGFVLFVHPKVDTPRHVDAVLVLGPPTADGRFDVALNLVKEGYADNLVVSGATPTTPEVKQLCKDGIGKATIICFQPDPRTTRGESMKIHQLARRYHWHSIMVVTSTYHVSRARTIMKRCNPETILMIAAHRGISLSEWAYQYLRQTAGYVKVLTNQSC